MFRIVSKKKYDQMQQALIVKPYLERSITSLQDTVYNLQTQVNQLNKEKEDDRLSVKTND